MSKNLQNKLVDRLKAEGKWRQYLALRSFLRNRKAVPEKLLSRAASWPFPPMDGSPPEYFAEPEWAEVEAKWRNGEYPKPPDFETYANGIINFSKFKEEPTTEAIEELENVKKVPKKWVNDWEGLAEQVAKVERSAAANQVDVLNWVFDHCGLPVEAIDPADVPSVGAVRMLRHASSDAGYRDFLGAWIRLLPDRKTVEWESRFKDSGQDLGLLDEYEASLEQESQSEPEGTALHANQ